MTTVKITFTKVLPDKSIRLLRSWAIHHGGDCTWSGEGSDFIFVADFQDEAAAGRFDSELRKLTAKENK